MFNILNIFTKSSNNSSNKDKFKIDPYSEILGKLQFFDYNDTMKNQSKISHFATQAVSDKPLSFLKNENEIYIKKEK